MSGLVSLYIPTWAASSPTPLPAQGNLIFTHGIFFVPDFWISLDKVEGNLMNAQIRDSAAVPLRLILFSSFRNQAQLFVIESHIVSLSVSESHSCSPDLTLLGTACLLVPMLCPYQSILLVTQLCRPLLVSSAESEHPCRQVWDGVFALPGVSGSPGYTVLQVICN